MNRKGIVAAAFAIAVSTAFGASILSPLQVLQATPPGEVHWLVRLYDQSHSPIGTLRLRVTSERGRSCLGGLGDRGFLIKIDRKDGLPKDFRISNTPVAFFDGKKVVVDLTGGTCDDYRLLDGNLSNDGGVLGEIRATGLGFAQVVGRFSATLQ